MEKVQEPKKGKGLIIASIITLSIVLIAVAYELYIFFSAINVLNGDSAAAAIAVVLTLVPFSIMIGIGAGVFDIAPLVLSGLLIKKRKEWFSFLFLGLSILFLILAVALPFVVLGIMSKASEGGTSGSTAEAVSSILMFLR